MGYKEEIEAMNGKIQDVEVPDGLIKPNVRLAGEDGNAFAIMGRVKKALKRAGNEQSVIDSYMEQSMAGDYDHLLRVAMAFTDHDSGDVEGWDDD